MRQRAGDKAQPPEQKEPEPERHRIREDDARQLLGGDAPACVEAIADRRAGQHREPDVVGDRVGEERRQDDAGARQRLADVGEGEQVVAGERDVVEDRQNDRGSELRGRRSQHVPGNLVPRHRTQLDPQHLERDQEQRESDDDRERVAKPGEHQGLSAGSCW